MVRLATSIGLLAAGLATIYSSPVRRQSIATVEADLNNIATQTTALDNSLITFVGANATLQAALNINTASGDLDTALQTATSDLNADIAANGPPSEADADTIIGIVLGFTPTILDALSQIVAKKPTLVSLPIDVTGLVLTDLEDLYSDSLLFEAALLSVAPADLLATGSALTYSINSAFSTAIAAYGGTVTTPGGGGPSSGPVRKRIPQGGVPKAAKRNAQPAADSREYLKRASK